MGLFVWFNQRRENLHKPFLSVPEMLVSLQWELWHSSASESWFCFSINNSYLLQTGRSKSRSRSIPNRTTSEPPAPCLAHRSARCRRPPFAFSLPESVIRGELRPLRNPAEVLEEVA